VIADAPSQNLAELSERLTSLQSQRGALQARARELDTMIAEVGNLAGEVEERILAQEGEYVRLHRAAGGGPTFGRDYTERTVTWTDGNGTTQLSGPRPLDTARGQADHARRILDALVAEAQPVRTSLITLQRERSEAVKLAGLIGGEIGGVESQLAAMRAEEAERRQLIGATSWRDRLSAILRRAAGAGS
jgi:hypothetical protein